MVCILDGLLPAAGRVTPCIPSFPGPAVTLSAAFCSLNVVTAWVTQVKESVVNISLDTFKICAGLPTMLTSQRCHVMCSLMLKKLVLPIGSSYLLLLLLLLLLCLFLAGLHWPGDCLETCPLQVMLTATRGYTKVASHVQHWMQQ